MLKKLLFKKELKQMERVIIDNHELHGMVIEQIEQIQELENQNATLDFNLEDVIIKLEHVEALLAEAEKTIKELKEENQ